MNFKSIGLLSMAITCATAVSLSISSCDSNKGPVTPGSHSGVDQGKNPQVLGDECKTSIGVTDCPGGNASLSFNREGELAVSNLNATTNTVTCTFDSPANVWRGAVDATFPASGGSLAYESKDDAGNVEARIDLTAAGNNYNIYPTFTSSQGGADTRQYDAYILNDGAVVGHQDAIRASDVVTLLPSDCIIKVTGIRWDVYQVNSQCEWKMYLNPCCVYRFQLPNGTILNGNQIKLVERNTQGVYVYLQTHSITTYGNVASYAIQAAAAYRTE